MGLMGSFAAIAVERQQPGARVEGEWQDGATTTLAIAASVQPLNGREVQLLPEGLRTKESIRVYARSEVRCLDERAKTAADVIVWGGQRYVVHQVQPWPVGNLAHWKAIAVKQELEDEQEGG